MRKNVWILAAALAAAGPLAADEAHQHRHGKKDAAKAAAMTGEVVDLACYMAHEGKGKKHAKCAKDCLLGGAPAGLLLQDGTVLLLVEDHAKKAPYRQALELAAETVKVTGRRIVRGGLAAVVVEKVEKAR